MEAWYKARDARVAGRAEAAGLDVVYVPYGPKQKERVPRRVHVNAGEASEWEWAIDHWLEVAEGAAGLEEAQVAGRVPAVDEGVAAGTAGEVLAEVVVGAHEAV
jgi:hypothetical protein